MTLAGVRWLNFFSVKRPPCQHARLPRKARQWIDTLTSVCVCVRILHKEGKGHTRSSDSISRAHPSSTDHSRGTTMQRVGSGEIRCHPARLTAWLNP